MKTPGRARGEVRAVWRTEREESTLLRDEADDKAYCPDIARESGLYTFRQSHNQEEGPIGRANIHDPERLVGESITRGDASSVQKAGGGDTTGS